MTEKQQAIFKEFIQIKAENIRLRLTLTEIIFRCDHQLNFAELNGWRIEHAVTEMRDAAKKALESPKKSGKKGD